MQDKTTRPGPADLFAQMGPQMYRAAYKEGMSLSAWLEKQNPSGQYKDGLDAFSRMMMQAGIVTRSDTQAGYHADKFEKFYENEQTRSLLPEWWARRWREAATGRPVTTRATYGSDDAAVGSLNNPYIDNGVARWDQQIAPAIPISQLVAITTPIDGNTYRSTYLTNSAANQRLVRVGESADIPTVKLTESDRTVTLYKFGRGLEATYESLRRMRIDKVAMHIARMAVQAETDKLAAILDVIVNGDGNSGTSATNYNLTTLDSAASAGTLTLKGWLAFKMKFANPYMLTTALATEATALQMMLLNTGSGNTPLVTIQAASGFGGFNQINPGLRDGVALGWTAEAPTLKIVAIDNRFAIERVYEMGANVQETERFIRNQTELMTFSEVEGYAVIDANAMLTLNVNA